MVALLPWTLTNIVFDRVKDTEKRIWYMNQTIENGWSKAVLIYQIKTDLFSRQVTVDKMNNFEQRLLYPQSELADELMKDRGFIFV